ncbi:hypothetical protein HAX54_033849, partial [Datura stramonium]|nr:hypothetical protein [Datura stramonium]
TIASKGKEVNVVEKSRNRGRPRKTDASSLAPKAGPTRRFGAKAVESQAYLVYHSKRSQ